MNAGMNDLHAGKIWSLIVIDENFSETIWNAVLSNNLVDGFDQAIHIYSDNTSIYNFLFFLFPTIWIFNSS